MGLTTSKETVINTKNSDDNKHNIDDNKHIVDDATQNVNDNNRIIEELRAEIKNRDEIIANLKHKTYNESDECSDILDVKKCIDYENLIFEGAGTKGIAYCGALTILETLGILAKIKRYAGSSAGAIIATLLAVGYNTEEITKIIHDTEFKKFVDDKTGIFRDVYCIMNYYGYCEGTYFLSYIQKLIGDKTGNGNMTFSDLLKYNSKVLVITGTNITHMNTIYFSHLKYPDMAIKDAVRISMSIPQNIGFKNSYT
jgi:predicted acylesterase/phospholipase RssA